MNNWRWALRTTAKVCLAITLLYVACDLVGHLLNAPYKDEGIEHILQHLHSYQQEALDARTR